MKSLLTTWGKSWHTWPDPTTPVPLGEPLLMWAVTGDGQADKDMVAQRDNQLGVSTAKIPAQRAEAIGFETPQVPPPKSVKPSGGNGPRARTGQHPEEALKAAAAWPGGSGGLKLAHTIAFCIPSLIP
jgi:hypothetical protein